MIKLYSEDNINKQVLWDLQEQGVVEQTADVSALWELERHQSYDLEPLMSTYAELEWEVCKNDLQEILNKVSLLDTDRDKMFCDNYAFIDILSTYTKVDQLYSDLDTYSTFYVEVDDKIIRFPYEAYFAVDAAKMSPLLESFDELQSCLEYPKDFSLSDMQSYYSDVYRCINNLGSKFSNEKLMISNDTILNGEEIIYNILKENALSIEKLVFNS